MEDLNEKKTSLFSPRQKMVLENLKEMQQAIKREDAYNAYEKVKQVVD